MTSIRELSLSRLDRIGLALCLGLVIWVLYDGWLTYGTPWRILATFLFCGAAYFGGRTGTRLMGRWFVPTVIVAVIPMLLILGRYSSPYFHAGAVIGVVRYDNARAALLVQAAFAAVLLAADLRWRLIPLSQKSAQRLVRGFYAAASAAAALFALGALGIRSTAGRATAVLLLPAVLMMMRRKARQTTIVFAFASWGGVVLASLLLAEAFARASDAQLVTRAGQALGAGRVALWSEAYELLRSHPFRGVGPDLFHLASSTARSRPGIWDWAHNEFLQVGAEMGWIGLVLVLALFGWLFIQLTWMRTAASAVAALALAAFGIHACVDYLFRFPILPAITAAMVGSAAGGPRIVRRRVPRRPREAQANPSVSLPLGSGG